MCEWSYVSICLYVYVLVRIILKILLFSVHKILFANDLVANNLIMINDYSSAATSCLIMIGLVTNNF